MRSLKFPPSLKPGIWGAVIGAIVISVLGFSIFGWTLGGTAERMAKERAQITVVDVLAPICAERFQQQADAPARLTEFNKDLGLGLTADHREGRLGQQCQEPRPPIRQLLSAQELGKGVAGNHLSIP